MEISDQQWLFKPKNRSKPALLMKTKFALGIEVEILFARNEQKDCSRKPDPQGNAQKTFKTVENIQEVNKT